MLLQSHYNHRWKPWKTATNTVFTHGNKRCAAVWLPISQGTHISKLLRFQNAVHTICWKHLPASKLCCQKVPISLVWETSQRIPERTLCTGTTKNVATWVQSWLVTTVIQWESVSMTNPVWRMNMWIWVKLEDRNTGVLHGRVLS